MTFDDQVHARRDGPRMPAYHDAIRTAGEPSVLALMAEIGDLRGIGIDPGYRTGCKVAVVDATGKFLENATIFPTPPQNKTDEAIELTRRALDRQPESVALQNNLAWFLAVYAGDPAAARPLIDQAIETAGELPPLLDTKGVVLLAQDQADAAIEVLEKSVEGAAVPSARYLHLAEAYQRAGRESDALRMLRQAEDGSLLELSPRDRKALVSLKVALP